MNELLAILNSTIVKEIKLGDIILHLPQFQFLQIKRIVPRFSSPDQDRRILNGLFLLMVIREKS